jgi:hypothetical protein
MAAARLPPLLAKSGSFCIRDPVVSLTDDFVRTGIGQVLGGSTGGLTVIFMVDEGLPQLAADVLS